MSTDTSSEHSANSEPKNPQNASPSNIAHLIQDLKGLTPEKKEEIAKQVGLTQRTSKTINFWKEIMAGVVAILAVLGFGAFIILIATLLSNAAMNDVQWERYTYLLAGVDNNESRYSLGKQRSFSSIFLEVQ